MEAKILLVDIETSPILAWVWSLWNQNVAPSQIKTDKRILCYAAKWLGSDNVFFQKAERENHEPSMLIKLRDLLDEADIVVYHNGDKFDLPTINARLLHHVIDPYSPVRTIDTLKVLKNNFKFSSNRLDYVVKQLGGTGKLETGGMKLWLECLQGDPQAWLKMEEYNIRDVLELEKLYLELRPWIRNHPNVTLYEEEYDTICPKCGGTHLQYRGYTTTIAGKYRRFKCIECGGWGREAENLLRNDDRKKITRNA